MLRRAAERQPHGALFLPCSCTLFGQGELNRLIFAAMHKAGGRPMAVPEIARSIIEELGHGGRGPVRHGAAGQGEPPISVPGPEAGSEAWRRFGAKWSLIDPA